jgi:hypothetical protein
MVKIINGRGGPQWLDPCAEREASVTLSVQREVGVTWSAEEAEECVGGA